MSLEFIYNLIDQASGPAGFIERALTGVDRMLHQVGVDSDAVSGHLSRAFRDPMGTLRNLHGTLGNFGQQAAGVFGQASTAAMGMANHFGSIGSAAARGVGVAVGHFQHLIGSIRGVADLALSLPGMIEHSTIGQWGGQIIDAMSFKESTLASLSTSFGSQEMGGKMFRQAQLIADVTPLKTRQMMEMYSRLGTDGFKPAEMPMASMLVGDLAATKGFNQGTINSLETVLGTIKHEGRIQRGSINVLGKDGMSVPLFFKNLAARLHTSVPQAMDDVHRGIVPSSYALQAITDAVRQGVDHGKPVGTFLMSQGKTIKGLWSTISSLPDNWYGRLVPDFDAELKKHPIKYSGFTALKGFMNNIVQVMNPTTPLGEKFTEKMSGFLNRVFTEIFKPLEDLTSPKNFGQTLDQIINQADSFGKWWERNGPGIIRDIKDFSIGVKDGFSTLKYAWDIVKPIFDAFSVEGGGGLAHTLGYMVGLAGAFKVLDALSFGGLTGLARLLPGAIGGIGGLAGMGAAGMGIAGEALGAVLGTSIGNATASAFRVIMMTAIPATFTGLVTGGLVAAAGLSLGLAIGDAINAGLEAWFPTATERFRSWLADLLHFRDLANFFDHAPPGSTATLPGGLPSSGMHVAPAKSPYSMTQSGDIDSWMPRAPKLQEMILPIDAPTLPAPSMTPAPAPVVMPAAMSSARGPITVHVTQTFALGGQGGSQSAGAKEIATQAKDAAIEGLMMAFERLAMEEGHGG